MDAQNSDSLTENTGDSAPLRDTNCILISLVFDCATVNITIGKN